MKRSLATGFVFGIGHAISQPMKNLHADLPHEREAPGDAIRRTAERPKKIHIVFEDDSNARGTEILIKHSNASARTSLPELSSHTEFDCLPTIRATL